MVKKFATSSLVILIFLLSYAVHNGESQEDYSYVLGGWEATQRIGPGGTGGIFTSEITIKEINAVENKAVVFSKWPDFKTARSSIVADSYEVNDALFKPGAEPVIEYKNPKNGREITLKFNKDGTGTFKTASTRGGEGGTNFGDLKKMK